MVTITIYNASCQIIRRLDLGQCAAGVYTDKVRAAYWNGKNDFGEPVSDGLYFYTIQTDKFRTTRKMVIVK